VNGHIDFERVNRAAAHSIACIVQRWLPDGKLVGHEWVALNPRRHDRHLGSFRVNLRSGRWSDFATGDGGGDVVSLAAYLFGTNQVEAALRLQRMLGLDYHG
jgi:hypothetical protein